MKKETNAISHFMLKVGIFALSALLPLLCFYIVADPFEVLRHYETLYPNPELNPARVGKNKGFVTIENFEERIKGGRTYNAFIFGASISIYYDAAEWASLLGANDSNICPYHFDSSDETTEEMLHKVEYLDKNGHRIEYALVILDPILLGTNRDAMGPSTVEHPHVSDNPFSLLQFHYIFFRASTNADFLKSYLPSMICNEAIDNSRNLVMEPQPIAYDSITNQESLPLWDSLISTDAEDFYAYHPLLPSPDEISISPQQLTSEKIADFERIAAIFHRHDTSYEIIVGPNRRKVALSPSDLNELQRIFGAMHIHDFSRSMADALATDSLLYDNTHYRPVFASQLMQKVYSRH